MRALTAAQMQKLDAITIEKLGISGRVLMELAGWQITSVILQEIPDLTKRNVYILVGKGNNGGDGLVIARHLHNLGHKVKVLLLTPAEKLTGDALANYNAAVNFNLPIHLTDNQENLEKELNSKEQDVLVDAIFGTGLSAPIQGFLAKAIEIFNKAPGFKVALDLPSGIHADTGKVMGVAVKADLTISLAYPKLGLVLSRTANYVGTLVVAYIGIPQMPALLSDFLTEEIKPEYHLLELADIQNLLQPRALDSHKGTYGHLLVLAGSPGKTGAAVLAGDAALAAGTGLITVGCPESLNPILEVKLTEVMTEPLPESQIGYISGNKALEKIKQIMKGKTALAIGPGLGTHPATKEILLKLLSEISIPIIIDADGLNLIADNIDQLLPLKNIRKHDNAEEFPNMPAVLPLILTPHPGEMARMLKISTAEVLELSPQIIQDAAIRWQAYVVLKGFRTLICTPSGDLYVNPTGNPGLASGGTGDVLTGLIGGFSAQKYTTLQACQLGVFMHGLAADLAALELSEEALAASHIIEYMPDAFKFLHNEFIALLAKYEFTQNMQADSTIPGCFKIFERGRFHYAAR